MSVAGKSALVTGGGSGMGEATAKRLARDGASVLVADRDMDAGARVVEEIRAEGGTAVFAYVDVSDAQSVHDMVQAAISEFGRLDLAANVAGVPQAQMSVQETDVELWQRVNAVNASGIFYCLREEIPALLASGGGAIVNVASLAGLRSFAGLNAYVASKHAAVGLTINAAAEVVGQNIRVNGVAPGAVATPMLLGSSPEELEGYKASLPMGRLGTAEEIANVIVFLLSDESSFVTGAVIPVDGGQLNV